MDAVFSSFRRVKDANFAQRFYARLFEAEPAIQSRFRHTDFAQQNELLMHGVYSMLDYAAGNATGKMALRRLARSHGEYGLAIPPAMYAIWLRCFLATLAEVDPHYGPHLELEWTRVLKPALRILGCGDACA